MRTGLAFAKCAVVAAAAVTLSLPTCALRVGKTSTPEETSLAAAVRGRVGLAAALAQRAVDAGIMPDPKEDSKAEALALVQ